MLPRLLDHPLAAQLERARWVHRLYFRYEDCDLHSDDLFADAEHLARELKKSRSRLYGDAVREYVARHSAESVTAALDSVCADVGTSGEFTQAAARHTLERSDW